MSGAIGMMFGNRTSPAVVTASGSSFNNDGVADSWLSGKFGGSNPVGSGDMTIEAWMYIDSTDTGDRSIFDCRTSATNGFFVYYAPPGNYLVFHTGAGGSLYTTDGLGEDVWIHVAAVRTGTTVRLFVDGVYKTSGPFPQTFNSNAWRVGAFYDDTSDLVVWKGYLDDIRFSSNVRYPSTTTFTPPTSQLASDANTVLLFNFTGANGSTSFVDDGPNNRTVTRNGTGTSISTTRFKY